MNNEIGKVVLLNIINKILMGDERKCVSQSYIWNALAGIINASQSAIIMIVIMQTNKVTDAGIYVIAFAIANLMLIIGKYNIRIYQITDYNNSSDLGAYVGARLTSCSFMLMISLAYVICASSFNSYAMEKSIIVLVMCVMKAIEAAEDVFHGFYQKNNRLDVAGRAFTIRTIFVIMFYSIAYLMTQNLLVSTIIATVISGILAFIFVAATIENFGGFKFNFHWKDQKKLFKDCFSLFVGSYMSFYIINAPRYAIDANLSDEAQAYYGIIAMPIFVVALLSSFLYQPIITDIVKDWYEKRYSEMNRKIKRQSIVIFGVTLICLAIAYYWGVPILSFVFNYNISQYFVDLLILLCGGGILAFGGFLSSIATIIRQQNKIVWCYFICFLLSVLVFNPVIQNYGIRGATITYFMITFLLMMLLLGVFAFGYRYERNAANKK